MSTNIEPWEASIPLCPTESEMSQAMEAEITKLRARTHADAKLIAEQNRLAKERQEWALHTNEVIRDLRAALALAQAPSAPVAPTWRLIDIEGAIRISMQDNHFAVQGDSQFVSVMAKSLMPYFEHAALSVKAGPVLGDPVCETGMPMRKMHRWYRRVAPGTLLYEAAPTPPTTGEA